MKKDLRIDELTPEQLIQFIKEEAKEEARAMEGLSRKELIYLLAEQRIQIRVLYERMGVMIRSMIGMQQLEKSIVATVNGLIDEKPVQQVRIEDFLDFGKQKQKTDIPVVNKTGQC